MFGVLPTPEFSNNQLPDLSIARELAYQKSEQLKQKAKARYDRNHKDIEFKPGDLVTRRIADNHPSLIKTSARNNGPFVVTRKVSSVNYEIRSIEDKSGANSSTTVVHVSQLQRFLPRTSDQKGENDTPSVSQRN